MAITIHQVCIASLRFLLVRSFNAVEETRSVNELSRIDENRCDQSTSPSAYMLRHVSAVTERLRLFEVLCCATTVFDMACVLLQCLFARATVASHQLHNHSSL